MRGHGGTLPKSLDSYENFKLEHTLFCHELRFVVIYALFRRLLATFENNSVTCSAGTLQFNYRRLAGYL